MKLTKIERDNKFKKITNIDGSVDIYNGGVATYFDKTGKQLAVGSIPAKFWMSDVETRLEAERLESERLQRLFLKEINTITDEYYDDFFEGM